MSSQANQATLLCEKILSEMKEYNESNKIWPSINKIIARLLTRRGELISLYEELCTKLDKDPKKIYFFFDYMLSVAAFWTPEKISKLRKEKKEIFEVNKKITELSDELTKLIERRSELKESGFYDNTRHHIVEIIEAASIENGLYGSYLKDKLSQLAGQYDFKYWPSLSQIIHEIGKDASIHIVEANSVLTKLSTEGSRPSGYDFLRAFFGCVENYKKDFYIPKSFTLKDDSWATLVNCLLDIKADELIDGEYVKIFRHKQRKRASIDLEQG